VQRRRSVQRGAALLGEPLAAAAARPRSAAHVAHLDLVYRVTWPLNVVITNDHLARYRALLPVFLQARFLALCCIHSGIGCTDRMAWISPAPCPLGCRCPGSRQPWSLPETVAWLQMHWAYHNLTALSCLTWTTRSWPAGAFEPLRRAGVGREASVPPFALPAVVDVLKHMHHVLGALRHTMLHTALYSAWQTLSDAIDRAAASAAGDASAATSSTAACSIDDLLRLHAQYLSEVESACWVDGCEAAQVRRNLYMTHPGLQCSSQRPLRLQRRRRS
jgi:Gamma tubulin complex component C-terminal